MDCKLNLIKYTSWVGTVLELGLQLPIQVWRTYGSVEALWPKLGFLKFGQLCILESLPNILLNPLKFKFAWLSNKQKLDFASLSRRQNSDFACPLRKQNLVPKNEFTSFFAAHSLACSKVIFLELKNFLKSCCNFIRNVTKALEYFKQGCPRYFRRPFTFSRRRVT